VPLVSNNHSYQQIRTFISREIISPRKQIIRSLKKIPSQPVHDATLLQNNIFQLHVYGSHVCVRGAPPGGQTVNRARLLVLLSLV